MSECQICGSDKYGLIATKIREGDGRIVKCRECGLVKQELQASADELRGYYEKEYQETHSLQRSEIQSPAQHFNDRIKTITRQFEEIKPYLHEKMDVLEVGCGVGALLSLIKPYAKYCVGVELNTSFINFLEQELGIEGHAQDMFTIDFKRKFDLIVMIDTLDHLPNPIEVLEYLRNLLKPGGRMWIEVPNLDEALNFFLPQPNQLEFNTFFWQKAHFFYFSKDTITKAFRRVGMKVQVTCRHDYTLTNFLNWYYRGTPMPTLVGAMCDTALLAGDDSFVKLMNELLKEFDERFRDIMKRTFRGNSLVCLASLSEP